MTIENYVGRGLYESWPTGATRSIEILEVKLTEVSKFLDTRVKETLIALETKFKPDNLNDNPQEKRFWKEIEDLRIASINYALRSNPK